MRVTWRLPLTIGVVLVALFAVSRFPKRRVEFDASYEANTLVAPSRIPGAGLGLFAKKRFVAGEVIGDMGGRLIFMSEREDNGYQVSLEPCMQAELGPYPVMDGFENGGHLIRVNFAPSVINDQETGFQNAVWKTSCTKPYFRYVATRDIEPGEEFLVSYGPRYNYAFMKDEAIRAHFCAEAKVDCTLRFDWKP